MNTLKHLLPEGAFDLQSYPEKKLGPYRSNLSSDSDYDSESTGTVSVPPQEYSNSELIRMKNDEMTNSSVPSTELVVSTEPTTSDISSDQTLSINPDEVSVSSQEVSDWPGIEDVPTPHKSFSSIMSETFFPPAQAQQESSSDINWSEFENAPQESESESSWIGPAAATVSNIGSSNSENTSDFFHNLLSNKVHSHYTKKGNPKNSRMKKSIKLSYKSKRSGNKNSPKRSYKRKSSKSKTRSKSKKRSKSSKSKKRSYKSKR